MEIPEVVRKGMECCGGLKGLEKSLPDDEEIARASAVHSALGDPVRLKIYEALKVQPLCVCYIKELVDLADSKLSYHLSVLRDAGLVDSERMGSWVIYRVR